jgi:hypothetical protein
MKHRPRRLLDQVLRAIRLKHYSMRTEAACVAWTKRHRQKQLANALSICPRRF